MNKNIKRVSVVCLCLLLSGCSMFQSALNDIKGNLVGNGYTIYTYDNYGSEVMETSGDKISITGNAVESTSYDENGSVVRGYELSSVITITVDGKEIESCGDTCIFEQKGLTPDVAYTGAPSHNGKRGLGTDKQPFLVVLSTEQENKYPLYIKLHEVSSDSGNIIQAFFDQYVKMSNERKLNTDGKSTYNILKTRLQVINEVIDYDKEDHRLYFLNKIISNLNQYLLHVYHGVSKRMLPLYYCEYEWRFNHRKCRSIMNKIKNYITQSGVATRKMIRDSVDQYAMARGLEIS